jgi:exodeoxyribonuclease III
MRLLSWNVNGLRSAYKKGFLDWLTQTRPDLLCLQETRAHPEQLPRELINPDGYRSYFTEPGRRGYSGAGLYTAISPQQVDISVAVTRGDDEGRILLAYYPDFVLLNVYFPNGKASPERLQYKLDFYEAFLEFARALLKAGREVIVCGDVNTAHREIDLARPRENAHTSGFLPEERAWIDRFLSAGFLDSFRVFNTEGGHYTWWDMKTRARERNRGWRIDYCFISEGLKSRLKAAFILPEVFGSDHCPVGIELS